MTPSLSTFSHDSDPSALFSNNVSLGPSTVASTRFVKIPADEFWGQTLCGLSTQLRSEVCLEVGEQLLSSYVSFPCTQHT